MEKDRTDGFFSCVAWRTTAENATKTLHKGNRVIVAGKLVQRRFEDGDGNKRSTIEIQVSHVGPDLQWVSASVRPRSSAATEPDEKQGYSDDGCCCRCDSVRRPAAGVGSADGEPGP